MKTRLSLFVAVAVSAVWAAEERRPLFNAVLTIGREHRVVIVSADGRVSPWLREGEAFDGWTVRGFDPATGTLAVERGGVRSILRLVPDAATLNAPMESPAVLAEAGAVLERMRFERMLDKLLAHVKQAELARVGEALAKLTRPEQPPEELGALKNKMAEAVVAALESAEVRDGVARSYREVFSAEELSELAVFYNAPFAQKLTEPADTFSPEETAALAVFRASELGRKLEASRGELQRKIEAAVKPRVEAAAADWWKRANDAGEGR